MVPPALKLANQYPEISRNLAFRVLRISNCHSRHAQYSYNKLSIVISTCSEVKITTRLNRNEVWLLDNYNNLFIYGSYMVAMATTITNFIIFQC